MYVTFSEGVIGHASVAGGMIGGEIAENELSDEVLASDEPVVETESGTVHVDPAGSFQRDGRLCREYDLRTDAGDTERAVACETEPGRWRLASSE